MALSMPIAEAVTPGPRVGEVGGLEECLDRAVLAERPVQRDHDDRRRATCGELVDGGADAWMDRWPRATPGRRRRRPVGRRDRWSAGSRHQRAVEVDEDLVDGVAEVAERVGDGRARHDRDVVLRGRPTEEDDDWGLRRPDGGRGRGPSDGRPLSAHAAASHPVQSPTNSTSRSSVTPVRASHLGADTLGEAPDVGRRPLLVVDDEVRVLLGHDRAADPQTLETGLVDEPAGRVARRVAEHAAGRRQPERLVRLSPAADVVEALLDDAPDRPVPGGRWHRR